MVLTVCYAFVLTVLYNNSRAYVLNISVYDRSLFSFLIVHGIALPDKLFTRSTNLSKNNPISGFFLLNQIPHVIHLSLCSCLGNSLIFKKRDKIDVLEETFVLHLNLPLYLYNFAFHHLVKN